DIDPLALSGTLENARKNHIGEDRLRAVHANILEDAERVESENAEKFHIVAANILADVIIPLTAVVKGLLREGGYFISSGILTERAEDVERALLKHDFEILEKNTLGEWCSFVARIR
ncbi:MAG: 50S ribosomal protein L11 methyltransferase, partial [Lachnospiraceae bacterium]|nr:50S ribosomal protein L11 methyltransferase [Lachnospiraceae bacterium]